MRQLSVTLAIAGIAFASVAGTANAAACYIVFDRKDTVVYQDTAPPVDLSEQGIAARDQLRKRGDYLMIMETDQCWRLVSAIGQAGGSTTVAEIVAGYRPFAATSAGGTTSGQGSRGAAAGARSSGRAAPAVSSRGSSMSSGYK